MAIAINGDSSGEVYVPYGQAVTLALASSVSSLAQLWEVLPPAYDDGTEPDRATNWSAWTLNGDGKTFRQLLSSSPWTPTGGRPDVPNSWLVRCTETTAGGPVIHTAVMRVRSVETGEAAPAAQENAESGAVRGWAQLDTRRQKANARKGQIRVYNNSGGSIANQWCRITGSVDFRTVGGNANPGGASSKAEYVDTIAVANPTDLGVFEEQIVKVVGTIANGAFGWATASGKISASLGAFSVGDPVYLAASGAESATPSPIRLGTVKVATSSGFFNARPRAAALRTYAQLRGVIASRADQKINLAGGQAAGDGGAGQFYWSTDTSANDDDGMVIVPTVGGWSRNGCWKRVNPEGVVKAAWFGVKAGTNMALPLQKAINAAYRNAQGQNYFVVIRYQHVQIPNGIIELDQTVYLPSGVGLEGSKSTWLKYTGTSGKPMIVTGGPHWTIRKIEFLCNAGAAKNCISIFGTVQNNTVGQAFWTAIGQVSTLPQGIGFAASSSVLLVDECSFREMSDYAIFVDHQAVPGTTDRALSSNLIVRHFDFYGPRFIQGCIDGVQVENGYLVWDPTGTQPGSPAGGPCFRVTDALYLNDVFGVGLASESDGSPQAGFVSLGAGSVHISRSRIGEGLNCLVDLNYADAVANGVPVDTGSDQTISVVFEDNESGTVADLIRCYDRMPAYVHSRWPNAGGIGVRQQGIWIKDDGSHTLRNSLRTKQGNAFHWSLDNSGPTSYAHTNQIREGTDPTKGPNRGIGSAGWTNVTEYFEEFLDRADDFDRFASEQSINLLTSNNFKAGDSNWSLETFNTTSATADTSLGYSVPMFTRTAANQIQVATRSSSGFPTSEWSSLPAGNYCFSCFVKVKGCSAYASLYVNPAGGSLRKTSYIGNSEGWQRVWFPFYYDGTNPVSIYVLVAASDHGSAGTFSAPAGIMINRGMTPAPYRYPTGDASTQEGYLHVRAFGTAPPSTGTWKLGDRCVNTAPTSGSALEWVCTVAGSPGTWQGVFQNGLTTAISVSAMRAILGSTNGVSAPASVFLHGRASLGDGGEGEFRWTSDSSTADDGVMVIVPTVAGWSRNGCWKRNTTRDSVNVRWFGATGDGTTNDATAVNAAVAYVQGLGGGEVLFPDGTYKIGTGGEWEPGGGFGAMTTVTLVGQSRKKTIIKAAPNLYSCSNCGIRNLTIDTSLAASGSTNALIIASLSNETQNVTIRDVTITNVPNGGVAGIALVAAAGFDLHRVHIENVDIDGVTASSKSGITAQGTSTSKVYDVNIVGGSVKNCDQGINLAGYAERINVTGTYLTDCNTVYIHTQDETKNCTFNVTVKNAGSANYVWHQALGGNAPNGHLVIINGTGVNPDLTVNGGVNCTTMAPSYLDMAGRNMGGKGASVASATTITLGSGNLFQVTGTTTIAGIITAGWREGSRITLALGNLTVTNNSGSPGTGAAPIVLRAGADLVSTGYILDLVLYSNAWRQPN